MQETGHLAVSALEGDDDEGVEPIRFGYCVKTFFQDLVFKVIRVNAEAEVMKGSGERNVLFYDMRAAPSMCLC